MAIPTRYPDAVWRPPPGMYVGPVRQKTDLIIWHVDAGNANSLYGWWNQSGSGQNGSHFFVKTDGTVEQYAPIDRIVWTSGNGSIRSVGIETQGYAAGEWTPAQRAALIKLTRWLCSTLGVPMVMAPNSKLTSRGIAWHRQGVPATQAQKAAKVSQTGGELWSSSVGKVCPGPDREKQIPHMVGEIANQSTIDPGKPGTDTNGFLMALSDAQQQHIYDALVVNQGGFYYKTDALINILRGETAPAIASIAAGNVQWPGQPAWNAFTTLANVAREDNGQEIKVDVDEAEIARQLAPLLSANLGALSDEELERISTATVDEIARRFSNA